MAPAPTDEERGTSARSRGVTTAPPRLKASCRKRRLAVPNSYAAFERLVEKWISRCVLSRTKRGDTEKPFRRERELVRGNESLRAIWNDLWEIVPAGGRTVEKQVMVTDEEGVHLETRTTTIPAGPHKKVDHVDIEASYRWRTTKSGAHLVDGVTFVVSGPPLREEPEPAPEPEPPPPPPPTQADRRKRRKKQGNRVFRALKGKEGEWAKEMRCVARKMAQDPEADDRFISVKKLVNEREHITHDFPKGPADLERFVVRVSDRVRVISNASLRGDVAAVHEDIIEGITELNKMQGQMGKTIADGHLRLINWIRRGALGERDGGRSIYTCFKDFIK
jgi:hypothetical protein